MIDKLKEKLMENTELGLTQVQKNYIVEELNKINVWYEVARNEVITAIEDIYNDELYKGYEEKIENISEEDINSIAWRVEDMDVWEDIYENARQEVLEIIEEED